VWFGRHAPHTRFAPRDGHRQRQRKTLSEHLWQIAAPDFPQKGVTQDASLTFSLGKVCGVMPDANGRGKPDMIMGKRVE
jgi:hypothetical protein